MAREAGAKQVYLASASPPVRHPNVYGIDMPAPTEFVAHNKSIEEICEEIGADRLIYQELEDLIDAVRYTGAKVEEFDCSCFNAEYVTGDVSEEYLKELEKTRNDNAKEKLAGDLAELDDLKIV